MGASVFAAVPGRRSSTVRLQPRAQPTHLGASCIHHFAKRAVQCWVCGGRKPWVVPSEVHGRLNLDRPSFARVHEALAASRAGRFAKRFSPQRIFARAHIYQLFDEVFAAVIASEAAPGCVW